MQATLHYGWTGDSSDRLICSHMQNGLNAACSTPWYAFRKLSEWHSICIYVDICMCSYMIMQNRESSTALDENVATVETGVGIKRI